MSRLTKRFPIEFVMAEAAKFGSRESFARGSRPAYQAAMRAGIIKHVCGHMPLMKRKWTDDEVIDEASKYTSRTEFSKRCWAAYFQARSRGILDIACAHMRLNGSYTKRMVYALVNEADRRVYVGLTYSMANRLSQHLRDPKSAINVAKLGDFSVRGVSGFLDINDAQELERETIKRYKSNGWTVLNRVAGGAPGAGVIKWTDKALRAEAAKYSTLVEFREKSSSCCEAARRTGIYAEITAGMARGKRQWTDADIFSAAMPYSTREEFKKNNGPAYSAARHRGVMDDACAHMPKNAWAKWNEESLSALASKYSDLETFRAENESAYVSVCALGLRHAVTGHLKKKKRTWSNAELISEARKYTRRSDFHRASGSAYITSKQRGIFSEAVAHMEGMRRATR
jgi:predicted GIY-YIG superfamily endonuclease